MARPPSVMMPCILATPFLDFSFEAKPSLKKTAEIDLLRLSLNVIRHLPLHELILETLYFKGPSGILPDLVDGIAASRLTVRLTTLGFGRGFGRAFGLGLGRGFGRAFGFGRGLLLTIFGGAFFTTTGLARVRIFG